MRMSPVIRGSRQRGSTMVELAISLLGFLFMMFGIMDFGLGVMSQQNVYTYAQDAVRWASVHGSESNAPATASDIQTYIRGEAVAMTTSNITVLTCWYAQGVSIPTIDPKNLPSAGSTNCPSPTGNNTPGSNVLVVVQYPFDMLSGVALRSNLTFSSTAMSVINN